MHIKFVVIILTIALLISGVSGCNGTRESDEELDSIDVEKALLYSPSKHIRLFDTVYTLRNESDRRYINMNWAFYSGYEIRESIFMHPASEKEYTMIDYEIDLSDAKEESVIVLEYGLGIADGVTADGVEFIVMINDELKASDVSKGGGWVDKIIDLSSFAGEKIKITLGTKGEPTTKYAWAAFSSPVINIIELPTNHLLIGKGKEIDINISGDISLEDEKYKASGHVILESTEFNNGDGYVVVSGTGNIDLKSYIGNNRAKIINLSNRTNEFKYLINIESSVVERDDWELALGLPESEITFQKYDYSFFPSRSFSIEMDSDSEYTIESINLWRKPGIVESENFLSGAYRDYSSNDIMINILYKNAGSGTILKNDGYGLRVQYTDSKGKVKKLPGIRVPEMVKYSEYLETINAGKLDPGEYDFYLYLIDSRGETLIDENKVFVSGNDISMENDNSENVFIENENLKLVISGNVEGLNEAYLYEKKEGRLIGTYALPRLVTSDGDLIISGFEVGKQDDFSITLKSNTDYGTFSLTYNLEESKVKTSHNFEASRDFGLKAFDGPQFLSGNLSFGRDHDNAVFAGIDYLSVEPSNNDLSTVKQYAGRFVPDTRKVTAPLMAIANNGIVLKYTWDENSEWIEDKTTPPARFESPALDGSGYGIMGIFAPSGTQYIKENELIAHMEYPIKKNDRISLESELEILYEDESVKAFVKFLQDRGVPELPKLNKEPIDVFKAMVAGLDKELIEDRGWIGFIGVDSEPRIQTGLLHTLIASMHLLTEEESATAKRLLDTVSIPTPSLDWSYADSIYWRMERDYIDEYYSTSKGRISSNMKSQSEDGTWQYTPSTKKDSLFERPGDITMGTVAVPTINLVKGARLYNDKEALESAYKGVRALEKFTKPAGAGPWELANSQPDLLAVVLGTKAALDLYDYTGDEEILDIATKIAIQGLPFIYFREIPRTIQSLYGTVPSFGSTNWNRPWQGSPVQWQGMLLSGLYIRLGKYDDTIDWEKIGLGMANMGINLVNDERWPGRFPDYLDLFKSDATVYNIWSELTAASVYERLGYINAWDQKETDDYSVISGYELTEITQSDNELKFKTKVPENMPCYILIHAENINGISVDGTDIVEYENSLTTYDTGYRKMTNEDVYVVKVKGQSQPLNIIAKIN